MSSYSKNTEKTIVPQMISELCEKYGWYQHVNQSYPNEIIFKDSKNGDYIYISLENDVYYLSTPLKTSKYNYKESCGLKGEPAVFYKVYDKLEHKLQYLE
jgi:hypothetical protein